MHRRELLGAAAGAVLAPFLFEKATFPKPRRVGVQLYTLRDRMAAGVQHTLEQVAAIGFREVEFAGYFDHPPDRLRRWLDEVGLTAPAAHLPLDNPKLDLSATLDAAAILGHSYVILASLPQQQQASTDGFRQAAIRLNEVGRVARAHGMRVAYHNHDFEFRRLAGVHPYTLLLDETDPDLVDMEVDVYWMTRAGEDPVGYFQKYPGRFRLCHLKDLDHGGQITEVGSGQIDFRRILAEGDTAGLRHVFIEHDHPRNSLDSVRSSYNYLRRLA
jgi:sugar phosphate isomerase/epimerase